MSSSSSDRAMTPQEVYVYIEAQTQWSEGEKIGVWALYTTYIFMIPSQKHPDADRIKIQESRRAQLLGYGIKV